MPQGGPPCRSAEIPNSAGRGTEWGNEHDIHAIHPKTPTVAAAWGQVHVTGRRDGKELRVAARQKMFDDR
jgi:hypothetical protein